ncbi:hemolysin III family protein [bacterium BFN5]|nr:hemolysin III family protein [bacterium BFN5]QJW45137.1 hemolysin III family protein [bacterium BFN5]
MGKPIALSRGKLEEICNAVTHGVGAVFALIGLGVLIASAYFNGGAWHLISFIIYGISLVLLYLASTLYHSFTNERAKYMLKIFDHSAIYLLIAGTYTPFTLVPLHGAIGWAIFSVIWLAALLGIILKVFFVKRFKLLSTLCYIFMGWAALIMIKPLLQTLAVEGLYWLIGGGILYTVGAVFYLARRLPFNHAIWHLFVLGGSVAHFIVVFKYVLPISVAG